MQGSLFQEYQEAINEGKLIFANHALYFARTFPSKPYLDCIYNPEDVYSNYFPYPALYCNSDIFRTRREDLNYLPKKKVDVLYMQDKCYIDHSSQFSYMTHTYKLFEMYSLLAPFKTKSIQYKVSIPCGEDKYSGLCWDPRFLSQYRFVIFSEPDLLRGYFTDRLLSIYLAGAIPVCLVKDWTLTHINEQAGIFGTNIDDLPKMLDKLFNLDENEILAMREKALFKCDLESQIILAQYKIKEILDKK